MIDIHCHILPGLDDGAVSMAAALEMARIAVASGTQSIVATPHVFDGRFEVSCDARDDALSQLQVALDKENISLTVLPGHDCHICDNLVSRVQSEPRHSLGGKGHAFLLELPDSLVPPNLEQLLFEAQVANLIPVLTHPERHPEIQKSPEIMAAWIDRGMWVQITAGSLTGVFGRKAKKAAEQMLKLRMVHVIASDAHNPNHRTPSLTKAVERGHKLIGNDIFALVTCNPAKLVA